MADISDYTIDDHTENTIINDHKNRISIEVMRDGLSGYLTITVMPLDDGEDG